MYDRDDVIDMLEQSNLIEKEPSREALMDAITAWDYASNTSRCMTTRMILTTHRKLLKRLRPDIAGKWRTCDVWIGGIKKTFVSEELIKKMMMGWIKLCNYDKVKGSKKDKEKFAKNWHIMFEEIHPFEDGNGRVGRILYNVHRFKLGLPIHIIRFEDRWEYYEWFK